MLVWSAMSLLLLTLILNLAKLYSKNVTKDDNNTSVSGKFCYYVPTLNSYE